LPDLLPESIVGRVKVDVNDLLKSEEVALLTGLSKQTLAQWRSQKRGIPYLKVGRAVRYDAADVQAYLEGCRVSVSVPKERRQM
jgi:excisionase family DNA binding protein